MDFSIIIVNYNSRDFLFNCIQSIIDSLTVNYEIIVIDNNSTDDSLEKCRIFESDDIRFYKSSVNIGFSRANNVGISKARGKFLHFLNPDTCLTADMNKDYMFISAQKTPNVYINPMKNRDGTVDYGRGYLPIPLNYLRYLLCRTNTKFYYIGATIIMPKNICEDIGKWNELFFMYGEDMELFYRIHRFNIPIILLSSIIYHYGNGCAQNEWSSFERELKIQDSFFLFYRNYRTMIEYFIMQILIILSFIRRPKRAWWQIKVIYRCLKNNYKIGINSY